MALKEYQTEISPNTLYKVNKKAAPNGVGEQLVPSLQVKGESVDVYGSQIEEAVYTDMVLDETAFIGLKPFSLIPNYLYFRENSGTPSNIIISGVAVEEA